MNLDWSILRWIQNTLTCPALDFLMPQITALGNGGAIWLLAAGGLICTKKYRKQGICLLGVVIGGVSHRIGIQIVNWVERLWKEKAAH